MKLSVKNLLAGLIIVIVLAVVFLRGDQLAQLVDTIRKGALLPLLCAPLVQLCKYGFQSFAYSWCFKSVGVTNMHPKQMLPLVFGCFFVNTVAPSFNLAGTTLVVDDARKRGVEPGRATSAALLMQITIDSGFAVILVIGFSILEFTVGLSPVWFVAGLVVFVLVGFMILLMVVGHLRPQLLERVLIPVQNLVNKFLVKIKKKPLNPWAANIANSFSEAGGLIRENPKTTLVAFLFSVGASVCELGCFALCGLAFGVHIVEALICGYVVATLFAMISITPQGVGVVETAVVVAFTSFGASAAAGLSIALVYRSIVFWMPFLIGAILIQTTKAFKGSAKHAIHDAEEKTGQEGAGKRATFVVTGNQPINTTTLQPGKTAASGPSKTAEDPKASTKGAEVAEDVSSAHAPSGASGSEDISTATVKPASTTQGKA